MARFHFRLERVAAFRRTEADLERARLEQLEAGLARLHEEKRAVRQERDRGAAELAAAGTRSESWSAQAVDVFSQYALAKARELGAEEARQKERIEDQRKRLVEAERKCELLAKLRERQFAVWRQDEAKALEDLAADVYLAAWNRRRSR